MYTITWDGSLAGSKRIGHVMLSALKNKEEFQAKCPANQVFSLGMRGVLKFIVAAERNRYRYDIT